MFLVDESAKENDLVPVGAPTESGGVTVDEIGGAPALERAQPAQVSAAPEPIVLEGAAAANPPTESGGVTMEAPPPAQESTTTPQQAGSGSQASAPAALFASVQLPEHPRLRVSFWFEGGAMQCEGLLMDDARHHVRRARLPVDPTTARIFLFFSTQLVNDLKAAGVVVSAPQPPASAPSSSEPEEATTSAPSSSEPEEATTSAPSSSEPEEATTSAPRSSEPGNLATPAASSSEPPAPNTAREGAGSAPEGDTQ